MENSGATVIFDEKTAEAIEEGKNRITLLQAEEARLRKLLGVLQVDISKAEAAISEKQELESKLAENIEHFRSKLEGLQEQILDDEKKFTAAREEHEQAVKEAEKTFAEVVERERAVAMREEFVSVKEETLARNWNELVAAKEELETRKTNLQRALESL